MEPLLIALLGLAVLLGLAALLPGPRRARPKRRSRAVGGLGLGLDEVFHPTAHQASEIRAAEQQLPIPAPDSAGGRDDLESGRIRL